MGFSEAVQWWEEWQLRVLVLASGFLQFFLFFAGILRKRCIPSWLRFLIWLAYLSSDAVAIYALATLFNRQKTEEWASKHPSARMQVLWAPILLMHLGGQDGISAYNIEDNELWRRHVVTMVSQVAVAVYVFRKSWAGDGNILRAGLGLFPVGIHKCVFKPWELKKVSINSLVGSYSASEENSNISSPDEYVRAATENFREGHGGQQSGSDQDDGDKMWGAYHLFVDLAPPYSDRLSFLKAMVHKNPDEAHALVRDGLSLTFDRLYTKDSLHVYGRQSNKLLEGISTFRIGLTATYILFVLWPCILSHNEGYDHTDVRITATLLCLVLAQDYCLPVAMAHFHEIIKKNYKVRWPDEVAQYNLMGYLVRNKKHKKLRRLATLLVCKDYIDQLWCMKPSKSSREITKHVHAYIAKGWTEHHIKDMATYMAFNDNRG